MANGPVTDLARGIVGNEDWIRRWSIGQTGWHAKSYDPYLVNNGPIFFGLSKQRVFLPLCGKSLDLAWFYDHGHEVLGVELAEQPIIEFFSENDMMYTVEDLDGVAKVYKNTDGRLHIIAADIFNVPLGRYGKFDVIWDRRSFTALNVNDHKRYRDLMYDIMKSDGNWYLNTVEYNESVWPGPPHSISNHYIKELFGTTCSVELLEENNGKSVNPNEHYLMTQKETDVFQNDMDGRSAFNVAVGKPADQYNTLFWNGFSWTADRAVDGCLLRDDADNQQCCSSTLVHHPSQQGENYCRLNLTRQYRVEKIRIYARTGTPDNQLDGFYINITERAGGASFRLHESSETNNTYNFNVSPKRPVTEVIIKRPGHDIITICEVQVFADLENTKQRKRIE